MLNGVMYELGVRIHFHLFENAGPVRSDGLDAEVKLFGYLLYGFPSCDETDYLVFPV